MSRQASPTFVQGGTIRIGIGAPLSGSSAVLGTEMKQAVELAIDEKNARGGILGAAIAAETVERRLAQRHRRRATILRNPRVARGDWPLQQQCYHCCVPSLRRGTACSNHANCLKPGGDGRKVRRVSVHKSGR